MDFLIVVDAQNDFVTGSLGTPEAVKVVPRIVNKISREKDENTTVLFTMDTHFEDYLNTQEGKILPIPHCLQGTDGWQIVRELKGFIQDKYLQTWVKESFGSISLVYHLAREYNLSEPDEEMTFTFMGFCTDVCVISNALLLKSLIPNASIIVDVSCCAGTTPELHLAAIEVMKSCQIYIVGEEL